MEKAYTSTADLTAVNDSVVSDVRELNTALITFFGTYAGTFVIEGTDRDDSSVWYPVQVARVDANTIATTHTTTNGTTAYELSCHAFKYLRVRRTVATSGTATVSITATSRAVEPAPVVGLATALPVGTNTIGNAGNVGVATNGATQTAINSAASTNAANTKSTAGTLYEVTIHNTTAAAKYIRFYNKATAPTVGTDTPVFVINVPANSSKEIAFGAVGKRFATGIGHAITNAAGVLDATAVAAGDVQLAYNWT